MKQILIIDDDPDVVDLLRLRLEAGRYEVKSAADGREGLRMLEAERPDLIILDVMMPNMDGLTFVRELKKTRQGKAVPVIVLTGKELMAGLFKAEGIRDYIVKPFDAQRLLAAVKKYV